MSLPAGATVNTLVAELDAYHKAVNQSAIVAPSTPGWTFASLTPTADRCYFMRFVPPRDITIARATHIVTVAAGSNDPCDIAIYDGAGTVKLTSTGATTGKLNAAGAKTLDFTTAVRLRGGVPYIVAWSSTTPGGTAPQVAGCNFTNAYATQFFGATASTIEMAFNASAYPTPATYGTPQGTTTGVCVKLQEAA